MIISGLETLVLGLYLIYVQNLFGDHRPDMIHRIFHHAQDPWMAGMLIVIGTYAITVALLDVNQFMAKRVALTLMSSVWVAYLVIFTWRDLNGHGPVGIGTILIGFVLVRLLLEAVWGDKT